MAEKNIKISSVMLISYALQYYQVRPAEYVRDFGTHTVVLGLSLWKARLTKGAKNG